jgi:hypothetical protein
MLHVPFSSSFVSFGHPKSRSLNDNVRTCPVHVPAGGLAEKRRKKAGNAARPLFVFFRFFRPSQEPLVERQREDVSGARIRWGVSRKERKETKKSRKCCTSLFSSFFVSFGHPKSRSLNGNVRTCPVHVSAGGLAEKNEKRRKKPETAHVLLSSSFVSFGHPKSRSLNDNVRTCPVHVPAGVGRKERKKDEKTGDGARPSFVFFRFFRLSQKPIVQRQRLYCPVHVSAGGWPQRNLKC